MRLASWNCAGGFKRKAAALAGLKPDLAVVCEVKESALCAAEGGDAHWCGHAPDAKGLALIGFEGWAIKPVYQGLLPNIMAAEANFQDKSLLMIGVWTVPSQGSYTLPLMAMCNDPEFGALIDMWRNKPVILAGDFNASDAFPRERPPFSAVRKAMEKAGFRSLWHDRMEEEFGQESRATHYHQWKEYKPFHIDYIFGNQVAHACCRSLEIGGFDEWTHAKTSDHAPIVGEFDLE